MPRRLSLIERFAVIYLSVYFGLVGLQHVAFLFSSSPWWHQPASNTLYDLRDKWKTQQSTIAKGKRDALRPVGKPQMTMMRSSIFSSASVASLKDFHRNTNKSFAFYNCSIPGHHYTFPQVPQFIIVGAQKSGTTALYEFLQEHPQIHGTSVPETHFFDWHYPKGRDERNDFLKKYHQLSLDTNSNLTSDEWQCALRKTYSDFFTSSDADSPGTNDNDIPRDTVFVEKTPSYLFLAETPARILETCFWKPKVIVLLRNPIDRAVSHYRMNIDVKGRTFESLLDEEMASFKSIGLSHAPSRKEFNETTSEHLGFKDVPVLTAEEQKKLHWKHYRKTFTTNFLQRGMYIVQLDHWLEHFALHESIHVIHHERFLSDPSTVYQEVLKFMDLPSFEPGYTQHNVAKYALKRPLSQHTRMYLAAFFRPYNQLLAKRLGPEWEGVWDPWEG
ncbi:unnamed protein product [Cylindrotheca closterium]|uniref:Sulfotransferase domain-containing protein n=1 Tax=Cylindrotheca closterium TaxID=2856 RepID=A0AAD2GE09_9STRA|nr:unnamed protein product [Cylindrotheca closterium]